MIDVATFDARQRERLYTLTKKAEDGDCAGVFTVLVTFARLLKPVKPDWEHDTHSLDHDLRKDIDVCMAALQYHRMRRNTWGR